MQDGSRDPPIPVLEWVFAAIGLVLVSGTLAFLAYRVAVDDSAPPDISLRVDAIVAVTDGYAVTVAASNAGERTAAGVKVEGRLTAGGAEVETSEATFQYLPPRSERRGGLFFRKDPRKYQLTLEAKGYVAP